MSLFPEYDIETRERLNKKSTLKIGIFGSFDISRKKYLDSLKKYLRDNSYVNTFDASDYPKKNYKNKDEKYEIALDNSESLLIYSEIRIIFLFFERDGEHGINESVGIEIGLLYKLNSDNSIILIIEDGAETRMKANLKGLIVKGKTKNWRSIPFDPENLSHEVMAESACYNFIGRSL